MIFVFGSNLAGRHGKGAAKDALLYHGAIYGVGIGPQGWSYAIPTKDHNLRVLPLREIKKHVERFIRHAELWPEYEFQVTRIGCGNAGYNDSVIAPLFEDAPPNCHLPKGWRDFVRQMT